MVPGGRFSRTAGPGWAARIRFLQAGEPSWTGKTVAELAETRGKDQLETLFDLVAQDPLARVGGGGGQSPAAKRVFTTHPRALVGSDVFAYDDTCQAKHPPHDLPHENTYSAIPWYLERHAPDGLEAAVHRLTGLPASWLGLKDRGRVAAGCYADLVVFSPEAYRARGDRLEPRRYPAGVHLVLVNGEIVVRDGLHCGARPGRVLRRR